VASTKATREQKTSAYSSPAYGETGQRYTESLK